LVKEHRKLLRLNWEGKTFQFTSLPFGLCTALWVLTKLLRPVIASSPSDGSSPSTATQVGDISGRFTPVSPEEGSSGIPDSELTGAVGIHGEARRNHNYL